MGKDKGYGGLNQVAIFLLLFAALIGSACSAAPAAAKPPDAVVVDRSTEPPSPTVVSQPAEMTPTVQLPQATPVARQAVLTEPARIMEQVSISDVPRYAYRVVNRFPHDAGAWTQGLVYAQGLFYEGTGLYGESTLRKVDPTSGEVLFGVRLPDEVFGEGITLFDGKLYQLTWKEQIGFIVDSETFELIDTFRYATEGWGLTHDGESLIMSDGSQRLTYLDPETLEQTRQIEVFDGKLSIGMLNELEYINGEIFANVWLTDYIARISPESGQVTGWIDLSGLMMPADTEQPIDVLNGVAYDPQGDRLFVTGKLWPEIFEIELIEAEK